MSRLQHSFFSRSPHGFSALLACAVTLGYLLTSKDSELGSTEREHVVFGFLALG